MATQNLEPSEVSTLCDDLFESNLGNLRNGVERLGKELQEFRMEDAEVHVVAPSQAVQRQPVSTHSVTSL